MDLELELPLLINPVLELAQEAGATILKLYQRSAVHEFTIKADSSPVTEADMRAHQIINAGLTFLTPDWPVLSEEAANIAFKTRREWEYFWLVDPLDGTKEFIHNTDEFTVNIALIKKHVPVLGVIYAPVFGLSYFACHKFGAFKQQGNQEAEPIHIRKVDEKEILVAVSRRHGAAELQVFLDRLGAYKIINRGSSLKSCMVAEGAADVYPSFGPTSEWDTAAAQCIVEEAGGAFFNRSFASLRYNTKESLINPGFLAVGDPNYPWQKFWY